MKVRSLLKKLKGVEFWLLSESGAGLFNGFVSDWDFNNNNEIITQYSEYKVISISTIESFGVLYITIKE